MFVRLFMLYIIDIFFFEAECSRLENRGARRLEVFFFGIAVAGAGTKFESAPSGFVL